MSDENKSQYRGAFDHFPHSFLMPFLRISDFEFRILAVMARERMCTSKEPI